VTDEVGALHADRLQEGGRHRGKLIERAGADVLGGLPVPGQVEREDDVLFGQCLVVEEPVAEVATEPVEEEDGIAVRPDLRYRMRRPPTSTFCGAGPSPASAAAAGTKLAWKAATIASTSSSGTSASATTATRHRRATPRPPWPAGGATRRRRSLQPARDLVGLDVTDLVTGGDAVADLPVPGRQPSFLHRKAPLRNGDGMDGGMDPHP